MNFTKFEQLKHPTLPTVAKVNELRAKYYPEAPALAGTDPKVDDRFERVTEDMLEGYAYDLSMPASEEATRALTNHETKALWDYVSGLGEVGKYEALLNDLAEASGDQPTSAWADRLENATAIMNKLAGKVKNFTIGDLLDLIGKLERGEPLTPPTRSAKPGDQLP